MKKIPSIDRDLRIKGEKLERNYKLKQSLSIYQVIFKFLSRTENLNPRILNISYWSENLKLEVLNGRIRLNLLLPTVFENTLFQIKYMRAISNNENNLTRNFKVIYYDFRLVLKRLTFRNQKNLESIKFLKILSNFFPELASEHLMSLILTSVVKNPRILTYSEYNNLWIVCHDIYFKRNKENGKFCIELLRKIINFFNDNFLPKFLVYWSKILEIFFCLKSPLRMKYLGKFLKLNANYFAQLGFELEKNWHNHNKGDNLDINLETQKKTSYERFFRWEMKEICSIFSYHSKKKKKKDLLIYLKNYRLSIRYILSPSELLEFLVHVKLQKSRNHSSLVKFFRETIANTYKKTNFEGIFWKHLGKTLNLFFFLEQLFLFQKFFALNRFFTSILYLFSNPLQIYKASKSLVLSKSDKNLKNLKTSSHDSYYKLFEEKNLELCNKKKIIEKLCEKFILLSINYPKKYRLDILLSLLANLKPETKNIYNNKPLWVFLFKERKKIDSTFKLVRFFCTDKPNDMRSWQILSILEQSTGKNLSKILRFSMRILMKHPDSIPGIIFTANHCSTFGSHGYALGEYFQAYRYNKESVLVNFLISIQYLKGLSNRKNYFKGLTLILSVCFFVKYRKHRYYTIYFQLRKHLKTKKLFMELFYNMALVFWIIGLKQKAFSMVKISIKWKEPYFHLAKRSRFKINYLNNTILNSTKFLIEKITNSNDVFCVGK